MVQRLVRIVMLMVGLLGCAAISHARMALVPCASPLATLSVERPLRRVVLETWRRSLTFRRQVVRLAKEPRLAVTVGRWVFGVGSESHARTEFTREGQRLRRADVQVKTIAPHRTVEFIAHELEHVLEQVDGVDLARMGGRSGVLVSGHFVRPHVETKRAQLVGRTVAAEYEAQQAVDVRCSDAGDR